MASIVAKRWKPLTNYMEESVFYLNDVTARFRYDNNVRTDEIQGHTYTATSTDTFDQIHVFIEGKKPLIEPEKLHQAQEDGERIFVEFENAVIRPYYSDRTKSIEDSIRATGVKLVETR